ncbi:LysR family transcriptional regulator [Blastococcus sp. SYSU D00820]
MKLEVLRRFVVLTEELGFTRAAQRLHIAQQVLSSQIKDLERQVGTRLFDRTTHRVALTPAGEEFLAAVKAALTALDDGIIRSRAVAAASAGRLRVGFVAQGAGDLQAPLLREFRRRNPLVSVEIRSFPFTDPYAGLLTGETDVALLRNPLPHPGVRLVRISEEPRIVLVPGDHPLADRTELHPEDLAGHPAIVVRGHDSDPVIREWMAVHTLAAEIGDRPVGAVVETAEEWLQAAEDGQGLTTTPASVMAFYPRPGLVGVPVTGVAPLGFMVGWRRELEGNRLVTELVDLATATLRARSASPDRG